MNDIFNVAFLENIKVLIVAILIYAIIFAILKKVEIFGSDDKVNAVIALFTAILVSLTGVLTYTVQYAINWFTIIVFMVFLIFTILMFIGIDAKTISGAANNHGKTIFFIMIALFLIIFLKAFFAVNNTFDTNNPQDDPYTVDTSFNTGVDDITNEDNPGGFFANLFGGIFNSIDPDLLSAGLFLLVLGVFVFFLGRK